MIFATPSGSALDSDTSFRSDRGITQEICQSTAVNEDPTAEFTEFHLEPMNGEEAAIDAASVKLQEEFDWEDPKTKRKFIQLEQKVLAKKADAQEIERYYSMKSDRKSAVFADRYLADYSEIQRLRILSEKIAELQKFLRPIKIG